MRDIEFNESVNLGGHRITNNDIFQLKTAISQLAQVYAESFGIHGAGGIVLAGVKETLTATEISYSGGWLFHQGAMWKVNPMAAQTITTGHTIYFIYNTIRNYPPFNYQSGVTFQPHIERTIDIEYRNTPPAGTTNNDFTLPFYVRFERIENLIQRAAVNTTHRELVESPWTELTEAQLTPLVHSGMTGTGNGSRLRYKVVGKQCYLQMSLITSTVGATPTIALKFPTGISLRNTTYPSIIAADSYNPLNPCTVHFSVASGNTPDLMTFSRSHTDTSQQTLSFNTVIEIA